MAYIITVIFSLFVTSLVTAKGHARPDRFGFVGTRVKRSLDEGNVVIPPTIESITSNIIQNETEYRHVPDYIRRLPELSIFKRAPVGFMGMRGKKEFEYPDYSRRVTRENPGTFRGRKFQGQNRGLMNPNPKRAPSGFMGMRGKKLIDNNLLENKRVPSGFFGMRGKKDLNDLDQYKDEDNIDLFEDLQNERTLLNDLNQLYDIDPESDYNYYNKRAPASGFFGMRGKRFYDYNENYDDDDNSVAEFNKRAPKGFLGMRGKRPYDDEYDNIEEEKREPKGFMGMRGKKDDSQQYAEKRSSLAQFFGIRGKKQPLHSGFFGMRGKKQPFEFRGKFVGVRGKRIPEGSLRRLEFELNDIPNNELSSTLNDDTIMKRAPSGFMGMRGKKWPETITLDE